MLSNPSEYLETVDLWQFKVKKDNLWKRIGDTIGINPIALKVLQRRGTVRHSQDSHASERLFRCFGN